LWITLHAGYKRKILEADIGIPFLQRDMDIISSTAAYMNPYVLVLQKTELTIVRNSEARGTIHEKTASNYWQFVACRHALPVTGDSAGRGRDLQ
jgi:hypothetical protein